MKKTALIMAVVAVCRVAAAGSVPERSMFRAEEMTSTSFPFRAVRIPLTPGEKLEYEARWMGFPSGRLVLECRWEEKVKGNKVYNLRALITFNSLMSPFYKVNNEAISVLDASEGFSRHFILNKHEGRTKYKEDVRFDYEELLARYTREESLAGPHRNRFSVQLADKVCDPLCFLYYLRNIPLTPGEDVHLPVHTSQRNWALTLRVLKRMDLTVPRGTYTVLKAEPVARFPGLLERRGRMYIYLEEKTHVPLLMSTDIPIGSISFRLVETENSPLDGLPERQPSTSGKQAARGQEESAGHSSPTMNIEAGSTENR